MTAEKFMSEWLGDMDKPFKETMIEFAKYHVELAISEIASVEANNLKEAIEDKEYMLKMYPLSNIV